MSDDRIELLAALVQRKWRALQDVGDPDAVGRPPDAAARLRGLAQRAREEWAAASLLLELAQENQTRNEESYFIATRLAHEIFRYVHRPAADGDINAIRALLVELCKPTGSE